MSTSREHFSPKSPNSSELIHISIVENRGVPMRFEIDIMKKFPTINLKFTFLPLSKPKCYFFFDAISCNLSSFQRKKKKL